MAHFHRPTQLKPFLGLMIASVIILNNIGCERVNNSLDEVRLECGTDFRPVSDDSLKLKLIGPGDQSLDTRSTTALGLKESGETIDLPISSRSCLALPASVTSVRMKSTVSGQVIGSVLYADKLNKKSLNKIELSKVPTFNADFVCPDEGYYGKDRVNVNIASEVDGLSENIGVQILARSVSTKTVFPLKEKKLGLALSLLGDDLDISQLPSGTYQLELATTDLGRGLKENYSLTSGRKSCELHKVDAMPTLGKSEGRVVVPSHKTLFESDGSFKISTCKVELATIKNLNACEVPAACEGDDKFVQSFKVLSESPGAFRYFYFHTDKANQRSNVSCKDIIVSETPPDLSIQWADPKYSFPTATVDKPIAKIALKISVGHSVVNREILNKNLMCSASFRIKPTLEIPASMITCESAECKGMNMSKPVPCGESLILSLQGYYDSQELWDSIFKVQVTSSDGADHHSQAETGVWLSSKYWTVDENFSIPGVDFTTHGHGIENDMLSQHGNKAFYGSYRLAENDLAVNGAGILMSSEGNIILKNAGKNDGKPYFLGEFDNGEILVSWDFQSECNVVRYDSLGNILEVLSPPVCALRSADTRHANAIYAMKLDVNEDASKWAVRPIVYKDGTWKVYGILPQDISKCRSNFLFEVIGVDEFIVHCESRQLSVSYSGDKVTIVSDVNKIVPADKEPWECNEIGIFSKDREYYFPWKLILTDRGAKENLLAMGLNSTVCSELAIVGESLYMNTGGWFYKINMKDQIKGLSHFFVSPSQSTVAVEPILESGGPHPFFITEKKELIILDAYDFVPVERPDAMFKPRDDPASSLTGWNRIGPIAINLKSIGHKRIFITDKHGINYITNDFKDWKRDYSSGSLRLIPEWIIQNIGPCYKRLPEFNSDIDSQNGRPSVETGSDLNCYMIRTFDLGEGSYKISITVFNESSQEFEPRFEIPAKCSGQLYSRAKHLIEDKIPFSCESRVEGETPVVESSSYLDLATGKLIEGFIPEPTPPTAAELELIGRL